MYKNLLKKFYNYFKNDSFVRVNDDLNNVTPLVFFNTFFLDNIGDPITLWITQPKKNLIKISDEGYTNFNCSEILSKDVPHSDSGVMITDDYITKHLPQLKAEMKYQNIKVSDTEFYILDNLKDFDLTCQHLAGYLHFIESLYNICDNLPTDRNELNKHLKEVTKFNKQLVSHLRTRYHSKN